MKFQGETGDRGMQTDSVLDSRGHHLQAGLAAAEQPA